MVCLPHVFRAAFLIYPVTFALRLMTDSIIFAPQFRPENLKKIASDEEF